MPDRPSPGDAVPEVLFVCVHNAGRSQMAAALLDHHANGRVRVRSAGSAPGDRLNPAVVAAMGELGIDLSKEFPKPLTDESVKAADAVITMGCGDACPIYPGKRYEDWELQDPAGQPVEVVRRIRDDIDARVRRLLAELVPAPELSRPGVVPGLDLGVCSRVYPAVMALTVSALAGQVGLSADTVATTNASGSCPNRPARRPGTGCTTRTRSLAGCG